MCIDFVLIKIPMEKRKREEEANKKGGQRENDERLIGWLMNDAARDRGDIETGERDGWVVDAKSNADKMMSYRMCFWGEMEERKRVHRHGLAIDTRRGKEEMGIANKRDWLVG